MGKSRAMEFILSGNNISADEALKSGLVSKVLEPEKLLSEAIALGNIIAGYSEPIVAMAKDCVNQSYNLTLD